MLDFIFKSNKATGLMYVFFSIIIVGCSIASFEEGLLWMLFRSGFFLIFSILYLIGGIKLLFKQENNENKKFIELKTETKSFFDTKLFFSNLLVLPVLGIIIYFLARNADGFGALFILVLGVTAASAYFIITSLLYLFVGNNIPELKKENSLTIFLIKLEKLFPLYFILVAYVLINRFYSGF